MSLSRAALARIIESYSPDSSLPSLVSIFPLMLLNSAASSISENSHILRGLPVPITFFALFSAVQVPSPLSDMRQSADDAAFGTPAITRPSASS